LVYDHARHITVDQVKTVKQDHIKLLEKGFASQQQGDLKAAEKAYQEVLKQDEQNEFALNLLGVVCVRTERYQDAIRYLTRAVRVNAKDPETHNNMGLAYKGLNEFQRARKSFEQSLHLNGRQPVTLNNLGNVFAAVGDHEHAIPAYEAALSHDPNFVDCLNNLAMSLKAVGRLNNALSVLDHAIRVDEGRSLSHNNKGEVLLQATQYEKARDAFRRAVELDGNLVAKINLSTALKQLGDESGAREALEDVLLAEENNTEAHNHLGVLLEQMGETELAAKHFRLALKYTPNHASSFYQLSRLKDHPLSKQEINKIESLLKDPKLLDIFRASLLFALAWDYEHKKEYLASIDYFLLAQAVKARQFPYDKSETLGHVEISERVFPVALDLSDHQRNDLPIPVFVVGMPRSGTTLTEQIVASHSEITGAGEVGFASDMVKQASELTGAPFPQSIERLTVEQAVQLRETYLTRMVERFGHSRFVVDKNPMNFNFLGAIATVFPEAKFLYCKRDPMDNCVSIFRLPFDDNQTYAHDLAALGHYYLQHVKLMDHWIASYPDQVLTVGYEDTVADIETQARRMLDFVGVEFQEQVLSFYATKRIVMTPSSEQVRQPIYNSSVNAWRRYGTALRPLMDALGVVGEG